MFLKKKNIAVIFWSSLIIGLIFLSTLLVYSVYLQWKSDSLQASHRDFVRSLSAVMYRDTVKLDNVKVVPISLTDQKSPIAVLEATLVNGSGKTIDSASVELSIHDAHGEVHYRTWIFVLSPSAIPGYGRVKVNDMIDMLKPGESFLLRHRLLNFPSDILEELTKQQDFARGSADKRIFVESRIRELSFI